MSGGGATTANWRSLVLSSGAVWVTEVLQQAGKSMRAGQETRVVEIPVLGNYGVFDQLHGVRTHEHSLMN